MLPAFGQESVDEPQISPNFKLDLETAARLRPQFMAQSIEANGRYSTGRLVFERLIAETSRPEKARFSWDLRIIEGDQFNAYSSPDGTIYVESSLGQLAGGSAGLWAAILSHEIAHVIRRDWARRYLYQESLERDSSLPIVLGDPAFPSGTWTNSHNASEIMARFCRRLEIDADRDGLMLMVKAGYHPAFVPALHHLLHAQSASAVRMSLYAMHPCWEERDQELMRDYTAASIEFEHRWPEWFASPGGNPPIVVFVDAPTVKKTGTKIWEIRLPMRCENLAGAVEVVFRTDAGREKSVRSADLSGYEMREVTGCTSPHTTIRFTLADYPELGKSSRGADINVLDSFGAVLAHAEVPKLPH